MDPKKITLAPDQGIGKLKITTNNKMNQNQKMVLAIAIVIIATIIGISVINAREQKEKQESSRIITMMRQNFMEGCMSESNYSTCDCLFNELMDKLGTIGMQNLALDYQDTGKLQKETVNSALKACVQYTI